MAKIRVMVLMGGKSPEHAVSLVSGQEVVRHLDKRKYEILPVVISPDGFQWQLKTLSETLSLSPAGVGKAPSAQKTSKKKTLPLIKQLLPSVKSASPDLIFLAMHGSFGEDGTIQGMLELAGIPYTGAGVLASALGMDKIMFRKVMRQEKIPIPRYYLLTQGEKTRIPKGFKFPLVVKPSNQGSSVGVSLVCRQKQMKKAVDLAFSYSRQIIVDEYLAGIEISCGVLGNEKPKALPVIEIIPKTGFFDYDAKYQAELCEEIVPARISKKLTKRVQDLALRVYKAIDCHGFGRVDMIIKKRKPYVLEINTIPGLTPNSLFPKQAAAAGISYSQLLDRLIKLALEKK